jgi:hypothetical protein
MVRPLDLSREVIADMRVRREAGESYDTIAKAHGVSFLIPNRLQTASWISEIFTPVNGAAKWDQRGAVKGSQLMGRFVAMA